MLQAPVVGLETLAELIKRRRNESTAETVVFTGDGTITRLI